ncbi:putative ribonuclease H-like domain-containing protein [Tanacetum coccineum]
MNYEPVTAGNQTNKNAGIKDNVDAVPTQQYILLPLLYNSPQSSEDAVADDAGKMTNKEPANKGERNGQRRKEELQIKKMARMCKISELHWIICFFTNADDLPTDPLMPDLEDTGIFSGAYDDEYVGAEANLNNLETTMNVSPIPITRIHKDHPKDQIIGDINSATQTRRMTKISKEGKHAIGTEWVYRNKKDERGIVVRNKAKLVAQGYTQEKGIDYDESAFLYGSIEEEVYVCQPPGFEDPQFPNKAYKVEKALYDLHQAPRAWYETLGEILLMQVYVDDIIFGSTKKSLCVEFEQMTRKRFQMNSMGELTFFLGLQVKQKDDRIFISQDKYVADILKKFDFATMKTASTPIETNKALLKDEEVEDVDVHLYKSMIRSLMYLTASRPDIMFAICACARFQVTPKVSHLHVVKRIFRYLKCQPKLGLWYARDSPCDLEVFSDSDYAGAKVLIEGKLIKSICSQEWMEGHVGDEAVHKKLGDRMERAATTASSLEAEQDNVYFLNSTHIKYALTENPTIYISLIHQFWQSASASTSENGEMEITATIDGRVKTVTKVSIRRHLKLKILMVLVLYLILEFLSNLLLWGPNFSGEGSIVPVESHHTPTIAPSTLQPPTSPPSMQTTHVTEEAATMSHDLPLPRVHSLRSDEGSMTLHELTILYTTLSKKVESLESDLKQTKLTYGVAYSKLIMKGRKITQLDEFERITLVQIVSTTSAGPEVKTAAESLVYIRRSATKRKDKGKAIMKEAEPVQKKTKLQLEQERLGYKEALRLQEQLDEKERQRISKFHEEANTFNSDILVPKILTESSKRTAETELKHEGSKRQKTNEEQLAKDEKELSEEELQKLMMIVPVEEVYVEALHVKYPIIDWEVYSEDIKKYWKIMLMTVILANKLQVDQYS